MPRRSRLPLLISLALLTVWSLNLAGCGQKERASRIEVTLIETVKVVAGQPSPGDGWWLSDRKYDELTHD